MTTDSSIAKYEHPYLTTDGVLFRFRDGRLQVRLYRNRNGAWCLPGGFVPVDRLAEDVLREKVLEKAGESGFYAEQLRTYDGLDRDPRARVVSVAYLCLSRSGADDPGWFRLDGNMAYGSDGDVLWAVPLDDLPFDHGRMIRDARERLANKLWWSDLAAHLLPDTFPASEAQALYELLEGKRYYGNFKRNMGDRLRAIGTGDDGRPGRKAVIYKWAWQGQA